MRSCSAASSLRKRKGQFMAYDAFVFALVCVWSAFVVASAGPGENTSPLEAYALGQDVLEACCTRGTPVPECFSVVEASGLEYCVQKNCGQINFVRECAGRLVHFGIRRVNNYHVLSSGNV